MLQLVCNLSNVCRGTSWQKMVNHRGQMATSLGYFPKILSKISSRGQIFLTYMTYICIRASSVSNQREILSLSWKTEGPKRYPNWGPNWGTQCFAPTLVLTLQHRKVRNCHIRQRQNVLTRHTTLVLLNIIMMNSFFVIFTIEGSHLCLQYS